MEAENSTFTPSSNRFFEAAVPILLGRANPDPRQQLEGGALLEIAIVDGAACLSLGHILMPMGPRTLGRFRDHQRANEETP
nr:hypothetical protein [Delftia acidovorans]